MSSKVGDGEHQITFGASYHFTLPQLFSCTRTSLQIIQQELMQLSSGDDEMYSSTGSHCLGQLLILL